MILAITLMAWTGEGKRNVKLLPFPQSCPGSLCFASVSLTLSLSLSSLSKGVFLPLSWFLWTVDGSIQDPKAPFPYNKKQLVTILPHLGLVTDNT